jgi:hypothetical protein
MAVAGSNTAITQTAGKANPNLDFPRTLAIERRF